MRHRKKAAALILLVALIAVIAGCGEKSSQPDKSKAAGIIIVSGNTGQQKSGKMYAQLTDYGYSYDLNAVMVYYFDVDAENAYAGSMNASSLTFGADIGSGSVGADAGAYYIENASSGRASA